MMHKFVPHICAMTLASLAVLSATRVHAQEIGIRGYTLPQQDGSILLVMPDGRYPIDLGYGCDGLNIAENVDVVAGSGGTAALIPAGTDWLCNVFIEAQVSDEPCAIGEDGTCDYAYEVLGREV
jgi:hypothetical protein